jgi:putative salt-induced outer membrane protein
MAMKNILILLCFIPLSVFAQLTNESEISLIRSGGNSDVQTTNVRTTNTYKWEKYSALFGGHYTYGENSKNVSVRNWDVNGKAEQELTHKVSLLTGEIVEGNTFIAIKSRYNSDLGARYYYSKSDKENFFTELSYRYTVENRYGPFEDTYSHKARLYNEYDHKYSENLQYKLWLEYIPNFSDGKDYLINGEASVTSILTSIFSLKVAYKGMYDNRPATSGFKNYDYLTTTSLVAKF